MPFGKSAEQGRLQSWTPFYPGAKGGTSMRFFSWAGLAFLLLVGLGPSDVYGQCAGGGGGGGMQGGTGGSPVIVPAGGQLLTGPGSWTFDVIVQQRMQRAQQQAYYEQTLRQANAGQAKKARRLASAQKRRAAEQYRRQHGRDTRIAAAGQ
jgi:hypothetical protein